MSFTYIYCADEISFEPTVAVYYLVLSARDVLSHIIVDTVDTESGHVCHVQVDMKELKEDEQAVKQAPAVDWFDGWPGTSPVENPIKSRRCVQYLSIPYTLIPELCSPRCLPHRVKICAPHNVKICAPHNDAYQSISGPCSAVLNLGISNR